MNSRSEIEQSFLAELASGRQFITNLQPVSNLHHRFLLDVLQDILNKLERVVPILFDSLNEHELAQFRYERDTTVSGYPIESVSWLLLSSQGAFISANHEDLLLVKFNEYGDISDMTTIDANRDPDAQTQLKAIAAQHRGNNVLTFLTNKQEQTLINQILQSEPQQQNDFFVLLYFIEKIELDLFRRSWLLEDSSKHLYIWMATALFVGCMSVMLTQLAFIGAYGALICSLFSLIYVKPRNITQFLPLSFCLGLSVTGILAPASMSTTAAIILLLLAFLIALIMTGITAYRSFLEHQNINARRDLGEPLVQTKTYSLETPFPPNAGPAFNEYNIFDGNGLPRSAVEFNSDKEVSFRIRYDSIKAFFRDNQQELIQIHSDSQPCGPVLK